MPVNRGFVSGGYSLRDVTRLLGLSRSIVGGLIGAGFVSPSRGPRPRIPLSFQDLVVLRAAQALVQAKVPTSRILRALRPDCARRFRRGFRCRGCGSKRSATRSSSATATRQWQPQDGQYVLRFQVESPGGRLAFLDVPEPEPPLSAEALFADAIGAETRNPQAACELIGKRSP
jgi:hypothetical protein